jgi:hypothetical protein
MSPLALQGVLREPPPTATHHNPTTQSQTPAPVVLSSNNHYINSNGNVLHSPAKSSSGVPAGASASITKAPARTMAAVPVGSKSRFTLGECTDTRRMKELAAEDEGRRVGPLSRLIGFSPPREIDDEHLRLMVTLPPPETMQPSAYCPCLKIWPHSSLIRPFVLVGF